MIARHRSLYLLLRAANSDDKAIVFAVTASLHQYGSFRDGDALGMSPGELLLQPVNAGAYVRVHQGVKLFEPLGVVKNLSRQTAPFYGAIRRQDFLAKLENNSVIGFAAGFLHLTTQFVGVNDPASEFRQDSRDECLTAGQSAGEPYAEHACCSASPTVFDISMAIVSGPTPPGTGL